MKKNEPPDPVASLIQEARPEMSRNQGAAETGFDTRLRAALGRQASPHWAAWEPATRWGLRIAGAVTAVIVLEFGIWAASQGGDAVNLSAWAVERILLGI